MQEPWYVTLYSNYAENYDEEPFTKGTVGECDFIEAELGFDKKIRILDVGCGTGRHAIELARRGYHVTGIDLSEAQLARARAKAASEHLVIPFIKADARALPFENQFDAAIMLCEGGFCLMETDQENEAIIESVARALTDGGCFIFTALNGLFPLSHSLSEFYGGGEDAASACRQNSFDPATMRDRNVTTFVDDDQVEHQVASSQRFYTPTEITEMLGLLGFLEIELFGATLGEFSREHPLDCDSFEMLVTARKEGRR